MNKIDYALRINNLWWYFQNPSVRKPKYLYIYRTMGSGLYGDDDNVEFEKWYWYHSDRDYGICELSFGKDEANFLSVVIPTDEKANFFCLKEILKQGQEEFDYLFDFDGEIYIETNCDIATLNTIIGKAKKIYHRKRHPMDFDFDFVKDLLKVFNKEGNTWLIHLKKQKRYEYKTVYL